MRNKWRSNLTRRYGGHEPAERQQVAAPLELEGRTVAVVRGTAHEAFINRYFRDCKVTKFDNDDAARRALKDGKVDFMFGDGMGMMFWA